MGSDLRVGRHRLGRRQLRKGLEVPAVDLRGNRIDRPELALDFVAVFPELVSQPFPLSGTNSDDDFLPIVTPAFDCLPKNTIELVLVIASFLTPYRFFRRQRQEYCEQCNTPPSTRSHAAERSNPTATGYICPTRGE